MRISDWSSDVCSSDLLDLDPRALQGDFLTAAFQHPTLGPHGTSEDTTVVYLVTRGPGLVLSQLLAIQRIDPAVPDFHPKPAPQGDCQAKYVTDRNVVRWGERVDVKERGGSCGLIK